MDMVELLLAEPNSELGERDNVIVMVTLFVALTSFVIVPDGVAE